MGKKINLTQEENYIKELQQYNLELNKYDDLLEINNIDHLLTPENNKDIESNFSIIAQTLMEIKLEMNLIRKNITRDMEFMISKNIKEINKKTTTSFLENSKILQNKLEFSFQNQLNQMKYEIEQFKNNLDEFAINSTHNNDNFISSIQEIRSKNLKELEPEKSMNENTIINEKIVNMEKIEGNSKLEQIRLKLKKLNKFDL
jgi:hypothetical protein